MNKTLVKERPILMSGEMVRAILDGRKTQTRRICVGQRELSNVHDFHLSRCPYGQPGDWLWVKETFYCDDYRYPNIPEDERNDAYWKNNMLYYRADGDDLCQQIPECTCDDGKPEPWRPSIFMPRWASRITLEITDVRVERLQDISEDDAKAEGVESDRTAFKDYSPEGAGLFTQTARSSFCGLWDSINDAKHPWSSNPWVWVLEFKRIQQGASEQGVCALVASGNPSGPLTDRSSSPL